jgi:hypothetical protein
MALHDDLLEQADHLASREPKKPRQASLRRAVSAAYYALFHALAADGARKLTPAQPTVLRPQVRRAYVHANMKEVCQQFRHPRLPDALTRLFPDPIEPELRTVAEAFVALQDARHQADYDFAMSLTRVDALQKVELARSAMRSWQAIRSNQNATVFLAALLLQRHWRR